MYGQNATLRSAEDMAYHVALFIARKNGTFINYYMVNFTPTNSKKEESIVKYKKKKKTYLIPNRANILHYQVHCIKF